jgi:hypothetical protein
MIWTCLVFLDDLAECDDLGAGEAGQVVDLFAALAKLALILEESPMALERGGGVEAFEGLGLEALYAACDMVWGRLGKVLRGQGEQLRRT